MDRTYCDGHAGFTPVDLSRIPTLLKRGILAGLWREGGAADEPPDMLWTIDDNGWIYELPITNAGTAQYHGYPLLPSDAFAKQVIEVYSAWALTATRVQLQQDPSIINAMNAAQGRYR